MGLHEGEQLFQIVEVRTGLHDQPDAAVTQGGDQFLPVLVEVLVLQFYQENIFLSMVSVLQFVFFVILFTQNRIKLTLCQTAK